MKIEEIDAAAGKNVSLRRALQKLQSWMTGVELTTGWDPLASATDGVIRQMPPPLATFTVTGVGGVFRLSITLPAGLTGLPLHEIKVSETSPFMVSQTVETMPLTPGTYLELTRSPALLYFQLRSKYLISDFNRPIVVGPVASGA